HRIESLANLSSLYLRTGQLTKAERLLQTINATEEAELDNSQRGAVLVSRADLAYSRHDFKQSQIWLEEAISLWERGFGPEDSNLVGPLNGLANVFIKIGDPANAIRCLQRAQSILEKNPNPVFLAHILVNFSTAQVMAGNTVAAESLLKKALEIA